MNNYDNKIILLKDDEKKRGACNSFFWLLKNIVSDYYFFCDHDDVWLPNKIQDSLNLITKIENKFDKETPVLVHSDMIIVDKDLNQIASSFWKYIQVNPKYNSFYCLSTCNNINGCTMLINNAAKNVSLYNWQYALMHDIWISLCVSYHKGIICYIKKPLVLYRLHDSNFIGANRMNNIFSILLHLKKILKNNINYYKMVNHVGKISVFCYLFYKLKMKFIRLNIK